MKKKFEQKSILNNHRLDTVPEENQYQHIRVTANICGAADSTCAMRRSDKNKKKMCKVRKIKSRKIKIQLKKARQMVLYNSNKIFWRKVNIKASQKEKNTLQRLNQNNKKGLPDI